MEFKSPKKQWRQLFYLLIIWSLLVFYPNPGKLAASVYRLNRPPVAPVSVAERAAEIREFSPDEIKEFVYEQLPYRFDWEVYNMPWYFPTLDEALASGSGDCKARYLLFASLLEELEIPYRKKISLTHIWVDYDGKADNWLENAGETLITVDEKGRRKISMPRPDLQQSLTSLRRGFWDAMPGSKKRELFSGFPLIIGFFYYFKRP